MGNHEPTYLALGQADFLTERTCIPGGRIPSYHAEAAQILAEIDLRLSQKLRGEEDVP